MEFRRILTGHRGRGLAERCTERGILPRSAPICRPVAASRRAAATQRDVAGVGGAAPRGQHAPPGPAGSPGARLECAPALLLMRRAEVRELREHVGVWLEAGGGNISLGEEG